MATTIIRLPNAIKQSNGKWTKEVELDEMTGDEEDILIDRTRLEDGTGRMKKSGAARITEILSRCTVRIGEDIRPGNKTRDELPDFFKATWKTAWSNDRIYTMIRLRQHSLGDMVPIEEDCPACKKMMKINFDLSTLKTQEATLEYASQENHLLKLPRSGDRVRWHFHAGQSDEEAIERYVLEHKDETLSCVLYTRIDTVNDGTISDVGGLKYVKKMRTLDRRALGEEFDKNEGGIDINIEVTCSCGTKFSRKLEVMSPTFFFPSATPSSSNTTSVSSQNGGTGPTNPSSESRSADADV